MAVFLATGCLLGPPPGQIMLYLSLARETRNAYSLQDAIRMRIDCKDRLLQDIQVDAPVLACFSCGCL